jgi:DsbC/DsbD-like thiol-disulfide interchange protein
MALFCGPRTHTATRALIGVWVIALAIPGGAQQKAGAPATKVSSRHLQITSYLSDTIVAPGARFSAVLDITPRPGIHIYAPEVKGYKPIRLTVQPRAGVVIRRAHYPRSEVYFFAALNEHVAVYQSPFRIVQDLMVDASRQGRAALAGVSSLPIKAVLDYQACDDKVCFRPESLTLSWDVKLRPGTTSASRFSPSP